MTRDISEQLMDRHVKQSAVTSIYSEASDKITYLRSLLQQVYNLDADYWPESIKTLVEQEARRG